MANGPSASSTSAASLTSPTVGGSSMVNTPEALEIIHAIARIPWLNHTTDKEQIFIRDMMDKVVLYKSGLVVTARQLLRLREIRNSLVARGALHVEPNQ